jgi:hypothetical protein
MVKGFGVEVNGQECDRGEANPSGEPRHHLLRDNPKCRELLDELHALGVREFRFALRYLDGSSVNTLLDRTWFAPGVRLTGRLETRSRERQFRLSRFVEEAIDESLVGTDAEGSDLFVFVYGGFQSERQQWNLTADVTAVTTDPCFTDRAIELI